MTTQGRITFAVCLTGVLLIVALIVVAVKDSNKREAACWNKGGVEIVSHDGTAYCVKRDVLIQ